MQVAIDTRTVDKDFLLRISLGRMGCAIANRLLSYAKSRIAYPLRARLKQHYSVHLFYARARLDLPTFEDPAVQRQLEEASSSSSSGIAWDTFTMASAVSTMAIQIVSQISVLMDVLKGQPDGPLLAAISLSQSIFEWFHTNKVYGPTAGGIVVCTGHNTVSDLMYVQSGQPRLRIKITSRCKA